MPAERSTGTGIEEALGRFFTTLNQIEDNLEAIRERENLITRRAAESLEGQQDQAGQIREDILRIGELMRQNRVLIDRLNRDLSVSSLNLQEAGRTVERLTRVIGDKELEIQVLREEMARMSQEVDGLVAAMDTLADREREKAQLIEEQTRALNTAWFLVGSRQQLLERDVIIREGGFLGIGRTTRLKPGFDKEGFTRLDLTRTTRIMLPREEVSLLSLHPEGSWAVETKDGQAVLVITDPESFWSATRYLVVETR